MDYGFDFYIDCPKCGQKKLHNYDDCHIFEPDALCILCKFCGFKVNPGDSEYKELIDKNVNFCKNKIIETLNRFKFLKDSKECIICRLKIGSSKYICNKCLREKFQILYKNIIDEDLVYFIANLFEKGISLQQISENEFGPTLEKRITYKCEYCNPIKGDKIIAFRTKKFKYGPLNIVHNSNCEFVQYFDKKNQVML